MRNGRCRPLVLHDCWIPISEPLGQASPFSPFDTQGRPITGSLRGYRRRILPREFELLEDFLRRWKEAERKQAMTEELSREGIHFGALAQKLGLGSGYDPFAVVAQLVWGRPSRTRRERAAQVKKQGTFTRYGEPSRAVLNKLLDTYADQSVDQLADREVLKLPDFCSFGPPLQIARTFGGKAAYEQAIRTLEEARYRAS